MKTKGEGNAVMLIRRMQEVWDGPSSTIPR